MADTKISALSAGTTIAGTEVIPGVQSAATVKFTFAQVATYIESVLATVATTGAYSDLSGKPSLATVATSGSYTDLTSKPTIPVLHPGYIVNNWYLAIRQAVSGGSAQTANTARFIPFIPVISITISQLAARCTTLGSSNIQLAIYAADATTHKPTGSQLSATGNISNAGTGALSAALGANVPLTAGSLYWLGINCGDSTAVFAVPATNQGEVAYLLGSATIGNVVAAAPLNSLSTPLTLGTWGDLTSATWTEQTDSKYANIWFKVASVP